MNLVSATDSGWFSSVDRMISDAANSFQQATNVKMIAVTMPGQTSGSVIRRSVCSRAGPVERGRLLDLLRHAAKKSA